jgi:hypothetical protein
MKEILKLYHGTDVDSALDILNNGLDAEKLLVLQTQPVQLGTGWYSAFDADVAWFFASIAPRAILGYTVIEMSLPIAKLKHLLAAELARQNTIANVPFIAKQVWFSVNSFDFLNEQAEFRPY